jgi:hypothetical protein
VLVLARRRCRLQQAGELQLVLDQLLAGVRPCRSQQVAHRCFIDAVATCSPSGQIFDSAHGLYWNGIFVILSGAAT